MFKVIHDHKDAPKNSTHPISSWPTNPGKSMQAHAFLIRGDKSCACQMIHIFGVDTSDKKRDLVNKFETVCVFAVAESHVTTYDTCLLQQTYIKYKWVKSMISGTM